MLSSSTKARLRLAAIAIALVPLGLIARALHSEHFTDKVARTILGAWMKYDRDAKR